MLPTLIKLTGQNTIFPFYHAVSDSPPAHLEHLYQVKSIKQFEKDLDYLLKYYRPMSLNDVNGYIVNGKKNSKSGFFFTLDDGLSEVYDIICPILTKKGIPAAIFINPSFIDNKDLFFRYKASLLIGYIKSNQHFLLKDEVKVWKTNQGTNQIYKAILRIKYNEKHELDRLAEIIAFDFQQYLLKATPYMTSSQITTLENQGFSIGGHSMDHPLYCDIPEPMQLQQTKSSVEIASQWTKNNRLFAFPYTDFGVKNSFFEKAELDISFGTAGIKNDPIHTHIQRIPMEKGQKSGRAILLNEYLYYILKAFINKNILVRHD